jgi:diguanylate cyclase (GGDEF)-like protein
MEDLIELAVVDDDGRIVAHSDPTRFNTVMDDAFTRAAIRSPTTTWGVDGGAMRVGIPARSGMRWGTVVGRYSLVRLEEGIFRQQQAMFILGFALAALAGVVLSGALSRLVVRPLSELDAAARRMGDGDLGARVPPLDVAEFTSVGEAFNRMAEALGHERESLERTVAERTDALKQANERLEHLALTDGLTGLHNHRHFHEALGREVARAARNGRPFGVLMIDVDHFKRLNDQLGHPAGDEVLRIVAAALAGSVRRGDVCARYGGEEFAVLLPETDPVEAARTGERARAAVASALPAGGERPAVSVSVGVAAFPRDGRCAEDVLAAADRALYAAKRGGRDRVVEARTTWA